MEVIQMTNNNHKLLDDWWWEAKNGWTLDSVREILADRDSKILNLIKERLEVAWMVARLKKKENLPVCVSYQEEKVINRWILQAKEKGVPQELINDIVKVAQLLMELSKKVQYSFLEQYSKPVVEGKTAGNGGNQC